MRRKIAAGNWKMNGTKASLDELEAMAKVKSDCDVIICPPATLIAAAVTVSGDIVIGGQDCHWNESGAHTGDLSAEILADTGAGAVIVGHSERRADHGEDNAMIANKTLAAWRAGLLAIVCVGETEAERDAGKALDVVGSQMAGSLPDAVTAENTVVAYEPVWAIGTGRTPTLDDIAEVHDFMRGQLAAKFGEETANGIRLLYGGSVKQGNAAEIFATSNVDGGLVGGASLKASDFSGIIEAAG